MPKSITPAPKASSTSSPETKPLPETYTLTGFDPDAETERLDQEMFALATKRRKEREAKS